MELSSRQIQDKRFATSLRGYDRGEVDMFRSECAAHTSTLEERTKIAEVHADNTQKELATLQSQSDVLLQEASDARHKIIEEAKAEASLIVSRSSANDGSPELSDAASRASAIIAEAEAKAALRLEGVEQIRVVAEAKAAKIVRAAEESAALTQAEADRQLDKALLDSNTIRADAERARASMMAQLAEIRQVIEEDLPTTTHDGAADPNVLVDLRSDVKQSTG
jgi:DivIVA domain-containing protein